MRVKSIDDGLTIVGDNHRYQIVNAMILFIMGFLVDVVYVALPLMETTPKIREIINGVESQQEQHLKYENCGQTFRITSDPKVTWVGDYDIYCDKLYVSLLGTIMCLGGLTGSICVHWLQEKGIKNTVLILCTSSILSVLLIIPTNLFLFYIFLFINGFIGLLMFMVKISIITEITGKLYRSYYNNAVILAGNVTIIFVYITYLNSIYWKYLYFISAFVGIFITIAFYFTYTESPRFLYVRNKREKMIESLLFIARFNKTDQRINFKTQFDEFLKELDGETDQNQEMGKCGMITNFNSIEDSNEESSKGREPNQKCVNKGYISSEDEKDIETSRDPRELQKIFQPQSSTVSMTLENFKQLFTRSQVLYLNFIISTPFIAFMFFLYMLEIKEYSYQITSEMYWYCLFAIIGGMLISPLMNLFGRKNTKLAFLFLFFILLIFSHFMGLKGMDKNQILLLYLTNRFIFHKVILINHTHFNESMPSDIRLKYFSIAHTIGKVIVLFDPFIYEYLKTFKIYLSYLVVLVLITCFVFQKETNQQKLEDRIERDPKEIS
jgi:MFS family permease